MNAGTIRASNTEQEEAAVDRFGGVRIGGFLI